MVVDHHLESPVRASPPVPDRLCTEERLWDTFPLLEVDRLERIERPADPTEEPVVGMVVRAARPDGGS